MFLCVRRRWAPHAAKLREHVRVPEGAPMIGMLAGPQLRYRGDLREGWPLGPQDLPSLRVQMGPGICRPGPGPEPTHFTRVPPSPEQTHFPAPPPR